MERRRHTPGLWVREPEQERAHRAVVCAFSEDGNRVMKITIDTFNPDGDGNIVLAAPDLLHALLCLKEWVEDHAVKPAEISEMQEAIAAIAKAEGRQ